MKYGIFKAKVNDIIARAGGNIHVRFSKHDGKYYADCSDGTTIIGNSESAKLTVCWNGRFHQAMVAV